MAERTRERQETGRETTPDGSRHLDASREAWRGASRLAIAITVAGLVAALLLVLTEFLTVTSVELRNTSCNVIQDSNPQLADRCTLTGFERNGGGFLLLAVLAGVMAWGAGLGASRPAALALCAVGVAVLAWTLLADLPTANETGVIGPLYEGASGSPGPGLFTELVAGVLALGAGAARLLRPD